MADQRANLLSRFLTADAWDEAHDILADHPELLDEEVLALLDAELERHRDDPEAVSFLSETRTFLAQCRQIGLEPAFNERMLAACEEDLAALSYGDDPASWVGLTLQLAALYQGRSIGDLSDNLESALAAYERALTRFDYEDGPESWIGIMNNLALLYTERRVGRHEENVEKAIAIYQEILARGMAEEATLDLRAAVMNNLGKVLCERPVGERESNLDAATLWFRQAIELYGREGMLEDRAEVLTNLGTVYLERTDTGPEELALAIADFREASKVLTPATHPRAWARALINLGNALRERARSGRARDREVAIRLYRRVLRRLDREALSSDWATAQLNLAITYVDQNAGDRGGNLERAVEACERGLATIHREDDPFLWADLRGSLGTALSFRIHGSRAESQERAISALQEALEIDTCPARPLQWAASLHALANVYRERIRGSRAENLETAIRLYRQALEVRTRSARSLEWADTRADLSSAYLQRVEGDRSGNIEEAIRGYREVLEVLNPQERPFEWSNVLVDLAVAHVRRPRGDRAGNLEEAIQACRRALEIQTRQSMPFEWARLSSSLGLLLLWRVRENRAENLEQALAVSRQALEVLSAEATPHEWADTLNNLGLIYLDRERGGRADNIEEAISCFQRALSVRTPDAVPFLWGSTLCNLGNAWFFRQSGDPDGNLEEAITSYERALEFLTQQDAPLEWAGAKTNLANAYRYRGLGDRAENLERALASCRDALTVRTRRSAPVDWAGTLNTLGLIHASRLRGDRDENRRQALAAFQEAMQVVTAESLPVDYRKLQQNVGNLHFSCQCWREAAEAYGEALRAAELLYQTGITPEGRSFELGENRDLVPRAVYSLARTGEVWEAVEVIERWKTRSLAEALARNEALLGRFPEEQRSAFRGAVERIRLLEGEAREAGLPGVRDFASVMGALREARAELTRIVEALRAVEPEILAGGFDAAGIRAVVRMLGRPLVYLLTTSQGSLALLIHPHGELEAVWADAFTDTDLDGMVAGLRSTGPAADREHLPTRLAGLSRLGSELVAPLASWLRGWDISGLVLIPAGPLALLPIHAAPYHLAGGEVCLLDEVEVTQAPSARALGHSLTQLARTRGTREMLAVGNPLPLPEDLLPLEFAAAEAKAVAGSFAGQPRLLTGEAASRAHVEAALWISDYLHLACHGRFDPKLPLESGLVLSHGERLTLRDLLDRQPLAEAERPAARLAVLSACESALIESERVPDEAVGLPAVFLQAGVPGVIGSLWRVDDLSTALLMIRFYEDHLCPDPDLTKKSMPPAMALRRAQLWLRDATAGDLLKLTRSLQDRNGSRVPLARAIVRLGLEEPDERPFRDPYYWASFLCVGV